MTHRALFTHIIAAAAISIASAPVALVAQEAPSARSALETIRNSGFSDPAAKVLAQDGATHPPEDLARLADALVQLAVEFDGNDQNILARKKAVGAVNALDHAGSSRAAVRYAGALERLRSIVERGKDKPVRSLALQSMLSATDTASLVPYLSSLAASMDPIADHAVSMLVRYTGEVGKEELKRLYRSNKIVEPAAKELVGLMASHGDW